MLMQGPSGRPGPTGLQQCASTQPSLSGVQRGILSAKPPAAPPHNVYHKAIPTLDPAHRGKQGRLPATRCTQPKHLRNVEQTPITTMLVQGPSGRPGPTGLSPACQKSRGALCQPSLHTSLGLHLQTSTLTRSKAQGHTRSSPATRCTQPKHLRNMEQTPNTNMLVQGPSGRPGPTGLQRYASTQPSLSGTPAAPQRWLQGPKAPTYPSRPCLSGLPGIRGNALPPSSPTAPR